MRIHKENADEYSSIKKKRDKNVSIIPKNSLSVKNVGWVLLETIHLGNSSRERSGTQ